MNWSYEINTETIDVKIPSNHIAVAGKVNSLHGALSPERYIEALLQKTVLSMKKNNKLLKKLGFPMEC